MSDHPLGALSDNHCRDPLRRDEGDMRLSGFRDMLSQTCVAACLGFVVCCLGAGCDGNPARRSTVEAHPATVPVLTEHRFKPGKAGAKATGEECSVAGPGECADGLCLHVGSGRDTGYFCSRRCEVRRECPSGWRCGSIHPSDPGSRVCIPPSPDAAETR